MKCVYRRREVTENTTTPKKLSSKAASPTKVGSDEGKRESEESDLAEDSERDEEKKDDPAKKYEVIALNPFKELYKCTPIYNFLMKFST